MSLLRSVRRLAVAAAAVGLVAAVPRALPDRVGAERHPHSDGWTASWAAAMTAPGAAGVAARGVHDATLRQRVPLSSGGDTLRLRLSHEYGARALRVGAVTVDAGAGAVPVTFGGRESFALAGGVERVSDPVPLQVDDDADLTVDLYLPGATGPLTQHLHGGPTGIASGDRVGAQDLAFSPLGTSRLLVSGVDVDTDAGAVVAFGDSITDGVGAEIGTEHDYPSLLADRVLDLPPRERFAVVNAGISGNRLLVDRVVAGVSAPSRFETDVLGHPGVRVLVLLEGINDILHTSGSVHPRSIRNVYEQLANRAAAHGLAVVAATLTPYGGSTGYTAAGEEDRTELNAWIRTSGVFDAVVDLDAAVRDPERSWRLHPDFDSGDGLHPNDAGYAAMAAAFDLERLVKLAEKGS